MPLFLLEFAEGPWKPERVRSLLAVLAPAIAGSGGEIVESQVATDLGLLYVVVQHADRDALAAVFFDVGGTLLEASPSFGDLYAEVFARFGRRLDPARIELDINRVSQAINNLGPDARAQLLAELERSGINEAQRAALG
jgi:hypothetical protein